jgi:hypothetical protein
MSLGVIADLTREIAVNAAAISKVTAVSPPLNSVEAHGGRIMAKREGVGKGTAVRFKLKRMP